MNIIRNKTTVKNSRKEEYDIPQHLDLLNKWTIPKVQPKLIYQLGTFEKLGLKQVVKTTEDTITIDNDHATFNLLTQHDLAPYMHTHRFIHIGLIQVAFKPLTLRGLNETFIAALRDGRNHNWKKSLIGIVQSSLAYGPVYFNAYPNLQISLSDENALKALVLNVKLHGYDYMPNTEVICICYRIYFKPLYTLNPMCKIMDFKNETILIETNFGKTKVTTRRPIKWEEIDFPKEWVMEDAAPPKDLKSTGLTGIEQTPEGNVKIRFEFDDIIDRINMESDRSSSKGLSRSNSLYYSHISPIDYIVETPSRASTSQIREEMPRYNSLKIDKDNIVTPVAPMKEQQINDEEITSSEMDFKI